MADFRLSEEQLRELADLVAERISALRPPEREWIDAWSLAQRLGVSREFCYDHQTELGGAKIGGRLLFAWPDAIENARTASEGSRHVPAPVTTGRKPPRCSGLAGTRAALLPVRGSKSA
jgi:hypothetical protein